jgi:S-adenosylmethionine synthetase
MHQRKKRFFTSECVCIGHPDKVCDQVSDGILDAIIMEDPYARVACETMVKTGMVMVGGEITTSTYVEIQDIVRQTIKDIGYTDASMGFDYETCAVLTCIQRQSGDIAMGVDEDKRKRKDLGAGDQGMMFGYACNETPELMPLPITLARRIANKSADMRIEGDLSYLRPDGKTQVTVEYHNNNPVRVDTVVLSLQHNPEVSYSKLKDDLINKIIKTVIPKNLLDKKTKYYVNPTGRFVLGGPYADAGLTGRKIICDTYGGMGRHGGGAFSGKDPTKVDRSAAYAARYAAKNIVAAGLAERCEVQLAYSIGIPQPVSIDVETFGTGKISEDKMSDLLYKHFDFSVSGIIEHFKLRRPIFLNTARYGHFGQRGDSYTWEKTDKAPILKKEVR